MSPFIYQYGVPFLMGFVIGFWARWFVRTSLWLLVILAIAGLSVQVFDYFERPIPPLEALGITARPDPVHEFLIAAQSWIAASLQALATVPPVVFIGVAVGAVCAITWKFCHPRRDPAALTPRV